MCNEGVITPEHWEESFVIHLYGDYNETNRTLNKLRSKRGGTTRLNSSLYNNLLDCYMWTSFSLPRTKF